MSSNRNRNAGNSWERECVQRLKEAGFQNLKTAREASRFRDAQKIDIVPVPNTMDEAFIYNPQCKTMSKGVPYQKILAEMPEEEGRVNVILDRQTKDVNKGKKGKKSRFMSTGEYAHLYLKDFLFIIQSREEFKKAYEALMTCWDYIPAEEQQKLNEQFKKMNL